MLATTLQRGLCVVRLTSSLSGKKGGKGKSRSEWPEGWAVAGLQTLLALLAFVLALSDLM